MVNIWRGKSERFEIDSKNDSKKVKMDGEKIALIYFPSDCPNIKGSKSHVV